jgi:hypothetical protein
MAFFYAEFFYAEGVAFTKPRVARPCELPWVRRQTTLYPEGLKGFLLCQELQHYHCFRKTLSG